MRKILKSIADFLIKLESCFIKAERDEQKKLVIIRKDGLGDYIIFYPTIRYYKVLYPDYKISLVVSKIARDFSAKIKDVDDFIYFDNKKFSSDFFYRRKFLLDLKRSGFETAIYPVYSRESIGDFMVWLTDAREKVGVDGDDGCMPDETRLKNNSIYDKLIKIPDNIKSEFERNIYFIRSLGANVPEIAFPTLSLNDNEIDKSEKIIAESGLAGKKFCIIYPAAGQVYKIWPADKYAKIVSYISAKGIIPVICGFGEEHKLASEIKKGLSDKEQVVDLVGRLDILTLGALLKKSLFYLGSDTGVAHLSVAVGTPAICLIGGGHFGRFFPYGDLKKNRIVYDKNMRCRNDNWVCAEKSNKPAPCVAGIEVRDVETEVDDLLNYLNVK